MNTAGIRAHLPTFIFIADLIKKNNALKEEQDWLMHEIYVCF
jgi:hypothetical protein